MTVMYNYREASLAYLKEETIRKKGQKGVKFRGKFNSAKNLPTSNLPKVLLKNYTFYVLTRLLSFFLTVTSSES